MRERPLKLHNSARFTDARTGAGQSEVCIGVPVDYESKGFEEATVILVRPRGRGIQQVVVRQRLRSVHCRRNGGDRRQGDDDHFRRLEFELRYDVVLHPRRADYDARRRLAQWSVEGLAPGQCLLGEKLRHMQMLKVVWLVDERRGHQADFLVR